MTAKNRATTLKDLFLQQTVPALQKELGLHNRLAVPRVLKVTVNAGVGRHSKEDKYIDVVVSDLAKITGQQPIKTAAKKAIAGFKIRKGDIVGVAVTLRGNRMYEFLQKLTQVALPRVRDFKGISVSGFDPQGNYNLGIREHLVFPEISSDAAEYTFPLQITVVTSARNPIEGYKLLKSLGFPFRDEPVSK